MSEILSANCNNCDVKHASLLLDLIADQSLDVLVLTETWITSTRLTLTRTDCFRLDFVPSMLIVVRMPTSVEAVSPSRSAHRYT